MKKTLSNIRKNKGLSQEDIAGQLGVGISTYCQYETGKRSIPYDVVDKLCKILDIKKDEIFLPTKFTLSKHK